MMVSLVDVGDMGQKEGKKKKTLKGKTGPGRTFAAISDKATKVAPTQTERWKTGRLLQRLGGGSKSPECRNTALQRGWS